MPAFLPCLPTTTALAAAALLVLAHTAAGAQTFSAQKLVGLSIGSDLNQAGQVAGLSYSFSTTAALWQAGAVTPLPVPSGEYGGTSRINAQGEVAGGLSNHHAVRWNAGSYLELGEPANTISATAFGINDASQTVGRISTEVNGVQEEFAVRWEQNGQMHRLPTVFGSTHSQALDINNTGTIAGRLSVGSSSYAVRWDNNGLNFLTNPYAGSGVEVALATAINQNGEIVGGILSGDRHGHAAIWRGDSVTELASLTGLAQAWALDINNGGYTVGYSFDATGRITDQRATLWTQGQAIDLNTALGQDDRLAGWLLYAASSTNDAGQILANGYNQNANEFQAFLLTPAVPEPETWALMLVGLSSVLWRRRSGGFRVQYGHGTNPRD